MDTPYLSQERYDELSRELEELRTAKRAEVAEQLKRAKEYGDLSENAEYAEAREEQARIEARIAELDEILKSAVIIHKGVGGSIVEIGCTVTVKKGDQTIQYTIVGSNESNPGERKISNESPLGRAFLGKKVGDKVSVETPGGKVEYTINSIA
jgi:transcription elongation factor GreA